MEGVLHLGSLVRSWARRRSLIDAVMIPAAFFALAFVVYAWINHGRRANLDYFVPLADAFLNGRLGLSSSVSYLNELVPSGGLFHVVYPPMPAVTLVPLVAIFGSGLDQALVSVTLGAANAAIASTVIAGTGVSRRVRIVLSLAFAFGTIVWYSAQAGSSWHFAHVVALLFLLLAIRAAQLDARPGLIGLLFAFAMLSRLTLIGALPFFLAYLADRSAHEGPGEPAVFGSLEGPRSPLWRSGWSLRWFLELARPFALAVAVPLALYLVYNNARFGSPFETGYPLIPGLAQEYQYRFGFFSVHSIPHILQAMFLSTPVETEAFPWFQPRHLGGLSILLTSPVFLWAIRARAWDWFTVGTWASVLLVLFPILLHADPGGAQFGFRYAQDLYPLLLLLTIRGLNGRISFEAGLAIGIGGPVNLWGMASAYLDWWA